MKELSITINLSHFISREDYLENWKELNDQFYADVYSYGINKDYRDLVIDLMGKLHTKFSLSKFRQK